MVASGDWTQFHNDVTRQGHNTEEHSLSATNADALGVAWTASTAMSIFSSPAVADGVVYVGSDDRNLYAYAVGCNSGGGSCSPLWTGATGSHVDSSPAVANGVVYVASEDAKLYAFDAAGVTGCSGGSCTPLWTGQIGGSVRWSSPAVANGVVYVGSDDHKLYAFDAAGVIGCSGSPKTCTPLWTAATLSFISSSPAVANGVVYVGSEDSRLYAFDAAGVTDCSGSPKTCSPLWTALTNGGIVSSPAVANGVVYVGSEDGILSAFDAAGITGCVTTAFHKTCSALWTAATGDVMESSPAVANGVVYVGSDDGKLYAFDAAGVTGCSGSPKACLPLWTALTGDDIFSSPAVANGVVYVGSLDHKLYAFDAAGVSDCSGSPKTCSPLWTATTGGQIWSSPAVSNGVVYVGSLDRKLYAYCLIGATYYTLPPVRVLDSRPGAGHIGAGLFHSKTKQTVTIATVASGVPADALAVTGNVTVVGQTHAGYVTVAPSLTSGVQPPTSTINFPLADTRANGVTVSLAGGNLDFMYWTSSTGPTVNIVFDVTGYFMNDPGGATYYTLTPVRVLDSRPGPGHIGAGLFHSKTSQTVLVANGTSGVPTDALAVTGNVTVVGQKHAGYVTVAPSLTSGVQPPTSTINFPLADTRANGVTVSLAGGNLDFMYWTSSTSDTVNIIFDVTGYFS